MDSHTLKTTFLGLHSWSVDIVPPFLKLIHCSVGWDFRIIYFKNKKDKVIFPKTHEGEIVLPTFLGLVQECWKSWVSGVPVCFTGSGWVLRWFLFYIKGNRLIRVRLWWVDVSRFSSVCKRDEIWISFLRVVLRVKVTGIVFGTNFCLLGAVGWNRFVTVDSYSRFSFFCYL